MAARTLPALFSLSLIFFAVASQPKAAGFAPVSAEDQAARMHRGMNILDDDPLWRDPAAARFQPRHFARLREAGFDTVRLNLHLLDHPKALAGIDRLVRAGLDAGLTVILDAHEDQNCARDAASCRARLRELWRALAQRYRDAPSPLLFELLNEPHGEITTALWNAMLRELLGTIRASNPERNVVIGPANMSSTDQLGNLDLPASDRHIIATVHTYTPVRFTLQGASWVPQASELGVRWGSDAELAALVRTFDTVEAWSRRERRPVFLGEFGVYEKAPMESRTRWIASVARIAEAHGIAWCYWQMDTDFAAYDFGRDEWVAPVLQALVP